MAGAEANARNFSLYKLSCAPLVQPSYKISSRNIPHKQEEAITGLIETAIAQVMPGQGAPANPFRLVAGSASLAIAAVLKGPIGLKLGTFARTA